MKALKYFAPAVCWFIISIVLLTLPGSAFPKENWLDKIWADKWIHIFLFGVLVWLWCFAFFKNTAKANLLHLFIVITICAIGYGVAMEFVQKNWVANRSFDVGDIAADAIGALSGFLVGRKYYLKK